MSQHLKPKPPEYVARCSAGCRWKSKHEHADLGPRLLESKELAAHDDKHVSSKARVLVRMLRDARPEVRQEVLDYFAAAGPELAPVFSEPITAPEEEK